MKRSGWLVIVLLALVLPVGAVRTMHQLADSAGTEIGRAAALHLQSLQPARSEPVQLIPPAAPPVSEPVLTPADAPSNEAAPTSQRSKQTRRRGAPAALKPRVLGVRVSAAQILALAQRGAVPRASAVSATAQHPAGLKLSGVAGLGVGMRDGDVLTHVAGTPVSSVAAVAELVIAARSRRVREISAEFWRNGERWALLVEQPYSAEPAPSSNVVAQGALPP